MVIRIAGRVFAGPVFSVVVVIALFYPALNVCSPAKRACNCRPFSRLTTSLSPAVPA